ncbi:type VII secretion AAA-ATPase EccA [Mycobacterium servetii]|uniref:Type VII secretion AAA-ATPase EccA n=1 Tax=Mycobacterium servetii TaxID=3237418 RepID=A0ABV4C9C7_9MYCO
MSSSFAAERLFTSSCAALGLEVFGRRQVVDQGAARAGFARLTAEFPAQCDGWRGLAAAGEATREVIEQAYRTLDSFGKLLSETDVAGYGLDFAFSTGLYVNLPAVGPDGIRLAYAAELAKAREFDAAHALLDDRLLAASPLHAGWVLGVVFWLSGRWHDVRRVLGRLLALPQREWMIGNTGEVDAYLRQAVTVAHGIAAANLGMWDQAANELAEQGSGPIAEASADALLTAALSARALDRTEVATRLLNDAYSVPDVSQQTRSRIADALSNPDFGIEPTTATRIEARTDYWDQASEPGEREYQWQLGADRRAELRAEAAQELAEFVGMEDVKNQVARLESSVRAAKAREARGMPTRSKPLHLVLKGPPGVGKTTIARVIGKLLCAAEVLPSATFIEVGRGDLVDNKIGGSENKVAAVVKRLLDSGGGILFIDEAYALTDSGSKNDFGPIVITELMRVMVDYADKVMVIVAGYADKMDAFLDSNEGLRSRIGREIILPAYTVDELVEIAVRVAARGASVFEDLEPLGEVFTRLAGSVLLDTQGVLRSALDVVGNGRFVNMLVGLAEEEREFRLDQAGLLDTGSEEDLETLTGADVRAAAERLLQGHTLIPVDEGEGR